MTVPAAVGAWLVDEQVARFRVWAPGATCVAVVLDGGATHDLHVEPNGYWTALVSAVQPGARYRFRVDGRLLADPASMAQPEGVHGPSALVEPDFPWTDAQAAVASLNDWVLYELHVGTFTETGTFDAVIDHLDPLVALGINAIELMPIAECSHPNWGYDGVFPWAAQHTYGGLDGLRRLVDACHARGIAVVLDVVYNHVGPEGAMLGEYGPYFTDRYRTPWGGALNFDGPASDPVREYFIEHACFLVRHAHVDGLRLDAVHAIVDASAFVFVEELTRAVHACGRAVGRDVVVIAESAANDSLLTARREAGGRGLDAQWSEDFHHALHASLTGERHGYYADYQPGRDLAVACADGFVYRGQYSVFHQRRHGRPDPDVDLDRLVVFAQNHDQVGNRPRGDRLISIAGFEAAKTALAVTLLAPSIPLVFMGEERAARTPFPYFVHHADPHLVDAVRRGRAAEFPDWNEEPLDPQAEETFRSAVLVRDDTDPEAMAMLRLVRDLISLRRSLPALHGFGVPERGQSRHDIRKKDGGRATWDAEARVVTIVRGMGAEEVAVVVSLRGATLERRGYTFSGWTVVCDTAAVEYGGPGLGAVPSVRVLLSPSSSSEPGSRHSLE